MEREPVHINCRPEECPFCRDAESPWTCSWCGMVIRKGQPWLLRSVPAKAPEPHHHDCYVYGLIPAEQDQRKRRHREEMAAAQEGGPRA